MPKIRIVDPKSGFRLSLPVPYRVFVNWFVRKSIVRSALQGRLKSMRHEFDHCPEAEAVRCTQLAQTICRYEQLLRAVDELDFGELRCALTDLSSYKGLVLVDVHAADGTIVHITV